MSSVQGNDGPQHQPRRTHRFDLTEFARGPWFPLVSVLIVVVVIVLALVVTGTVTGLAAALTALAGVLIALGGVLAAAAKYHR